MFISGWVIKPNCLEAATVSFPFPATWGQQKRENIFVSEWGVVSGHRDTVGSKLQERDSQWTMSQNTGPISLFEVQPYPHSVSHLYYLSGWSWDSQQPQRSKRTGSDDHLLVHHDPQHSKSEWSERSKINEEVSWHEMKQKKKTDLQF